VYSQVLNITSIPLLRAKTTRPLRRSYRASMAIGHVLAPAQLSLWLSSRRPE
jgi:hypothetical protein